MFKLLEDWVEYAVQRDWFKSWKSETAITEVSDADEEAVAEPVYISEPVRSIVQCYLDNPGRWKITTERGKASDKYVLLDKETGEEFVGRYWYPIDKFTFTSHKWISKEEAVWAYNTINEFALERAEKLRSLRNQRQRKRLMRMYVKED